MNVMSRNSALLPKDKRILIRLGENIRLARLRRNYSAEMVADRAGISRTTLWNLERGRPTTSIVTLLQVLSVFGLEQDLMTLAEDDVLGRKIQDADLIIGKRAKKRK